MPSPTATLLSTLPGFATVYTANQTFVDGQMVPLADKYIPAEVWGDRATLARALWCAHRTTVLLRGGGQRGMVVSESAGGVSQSFAAPAVSGPASVDGDFRTTVYGQQFVELRNQLGIGLQLL